MNRPLYYIFLISFCVVIFSSCNNDDEDLIETQQERIERYLASYEVEYVLQDDGVYKYLAYRDPANDESEVAVKGDSLVFRFAGYTFVNAPEELFYTNNRYLVENDTILNTKYWSFEPKRIKLGDGSIIKSLESSLLNSKEGDSLLVFLTSDIGYGDKSMGIVEENTALMFVLNIDEIIK